MQSVHPTVTSKLRSQVEAQVPDKALLGAALFFGQGTLKAVLLSENPILGAKDAWQAAAGEAQASGLPEAVAVAVFQHEVILLRSSLGRVTVGEPVASLKRGQFTATARDYAVKTRLELHSELIAAVLEAKYLPVGPNRFSRRVARLVQDLGRPGD